MLILAILYLLLNHVSAFDRELLTAAGLSNKIVDQVSFNYQKHRAKISRPDQMGIVDFTKASYEPRFYLFDFSTRKFTIYFVTHGINSGTNWVIQTSNELKDDQDIGSKRSAHGSFLTLSTKVSQRTGYSLTIDGLDLDNKNTFKRFIYIHGGQGVNKDWQDSHNGIFKRSQGCFVVDEPFRLEVIEQLKEGSFLYAYWNQEETLEKFIASPEYSFNKFDALINKLGIWETGEEEPVD